MMHAYTKPEAEVPQTQADDLHSALAFDNLRTQVAIQQRQIESLVAAQAQLVKDLGWLTDTVREMVTVVSAVGGAK